MPPKPNPRGKIQSVLPITTKTTNGKRKASDAASSSSKQAKKDEDHHVHSDTQGAQKNEDGENGTSLEFVQRAFYPPEMSNMRAMEYKSGERPRPLALLNAAQKLTARARGETKPGKSVVHWFKNDLRVRDNKSLHSASEKATKAGIPLVCLYLISPEDYEAHLTAPSRVDFIFRTLAILKHDLAELDIPLHVETVAKRKQLPSRLIELVESWGAKHVYANVEYEVDELRREIALTKDFLKRGIAFNVLPDTCVVSPGELATGTGNQYAVFSPWFRAWVAFLHKHPAHLEPHPSPSKNPAGTRATFQDTFNQAIPGLPDNKQLSEEEKERFAKLWPAGEPEAHSRLERHIKERITGYKEQRNLPGVPGTSMLSVHFAAGTLSARTAVRAARDANRSSSTKLDGGSPGIQTWISEIAWRDFYRHVLAHWPYVCMSKPWKPEYANIEWEYDTGKLEAWRAGRTGYPIVDAAMRQLLHMNWMHNRCRMIVASFLAKDLLLDWRLGERWFMENLVDGDFASNNGGWGWSSSAGVDPQPYFRIFNPLLQSEKFDPDGEYIRKWVPELRGVKGKAIHAPYDRGEGKKAEKEGYPKPVVEHKFARDRALARYKEGLAKPMA